MQTLQERYDELNYRTELLKVQTQSLLKDLLSKLDERALEGYSFNQGLNVIYSHIPGTLEGEAADYYSENFWTLRFDEWSQEDQMDLIKLIFDNNLIK